MRSLGVSQPRACNNLGSLYQYGKGVAVDYPQAVALYRRACDEHDSVGCGNLGAMYAQGLGVGRDEKLAAELFKRACAAGIETACQRLAHLLSEKPR